MHETAKGNGGEERKQPPVSTYAKIAYALHQRGTLKVSKPVAVIHMKPQRVKEDAVAEVKPKKDSEEKRHKRRKHKGKRSKRKHDVPTTPLDQDQLEASNPTPDVEDNEKTVALQEKPSTLPLRSSKRHTFVFPLQGGAVLHENSPTPSEGNTTAASTQAPAALTDGLDRYPEILVDHSCISVRSGLSCTDSLSSGWSRCTPPTSATMMATVEDEYKLDQEHDLTTDQVETNVDDEEEDEVDSWGSGMPRNDIFSKWNVFDNGNDKKKEEEEEEESVSSTSVFSHERDDDSTLPTDRESDVESLQSQQCQYHDDYNYYFYDDDDNVDLVAASDSESRQYPLFLARGDSESTCSYFGFPQPPSSQPTTTATATGQVLLPPPARRSQPVPLVRHLSRRKSFNMKRNHPAGQLYPFDGTLTEI